MDLASKQVRESRVLTTLLDLLAGYRQATLQLARRGRSLHWMSHFALFFHTHRDSGVLIQGRLTSLRPRPECVL